MMIDSNGVHGTNLHTDGLLTSMFPSLYRQQPVFRTVESDE